jgi:hypothetical protein
MKEGYRVTIVGGHSRGVKGFLTTCPCCRILSFLEETRAERASEKEAS